MFSPDEVHNGTWEQRWAARDRAMQTYYTAHPERFHARPVTPAPAGYVGINLPEERKNELERLHAA